MANPDNRPFYVLARDGLRSYPAAVRELQKEAHVNRRSQQRTRRYSNNRMEFDHRFVKCRHRAMQGPRTPATAWRAIQRIEAAQMSRKGLRGYFAARRPGARDSRAEQEKLIYLNRITLIGVLGGDAEKKVSNASNIAVFSLATNTSWKNEAATWGSRTGWH